MDAWISHFQQLPDATEREAFFNDLVRHYGELFDATGSGYLLLDAGQRILAWNTLAETLLGHRPATGEVMPRPGDLFELDASGDGHCVIDAALAEGRSGRQILTLRLDGEAHWLRLTALPVSLADHRQALVVLQDISAEKRLEADVLAQREALDDVRVRDTLTGLNNRRYILQQLDRLNAQAKRYGTAFSIALIDLDHFKSVNDTYGHEAADRVLLTLARLITDELRDADIGARYGEEEFMVLLPETGVEAAVQTINRLRQRFTECRVEGIGRSLTLSAGVLGWGPGQSLEQLVFHTDQRLAMAKHAGRNQVCGDL